MQPGSKTLGIKTLLGSNSAAPVLDLVLDMGHGGTDPGAVSHGLTEKHYVLAIGLRLEKRLLSKYPDQLRIHMTRRDDSSVDLLTRSEIANSLPGDAVFSSLHFNAASNVAKKGWETYVYGEVSWIPAVSGAGAYATVMEVFTHEGETIQAFPAEHIYGLETRGGATVFAGMESLDHKAPRSYDVAKRMAPVWNAFCTKHGEVDRGIWCGNFSVLRETARRALLFEFAYSTNDEDAALLKSETYQTDLVEALATMIGTAFGLKASETWAYPKVKVVLQDGREVWAEVKEGHTVIPITFRVGDGPEQQGYWPVRSWWEGVMGGKVRWVESPPTAYLE